MRNIMSAQHRLHRTGFSYPPLIPLLGGKIWYDFVVVIQKSDILQEVKRWM